MLFFRLQPSGLGIDHLSETSSGELADGLHVFVGAHEVVRLDALPPEWYGDEVVVIEANHFWPNDDVEGVCIDGAQARVVARIPFSEFNPDEWNA